MTKKFDLRRKPLDSTADRYVELRFGEQATADQRQIAARELAKWNPQVNWYLLTHWEDYYVTESEQKAIDAGFDVLLQQLAVKNQRHEKKPPIVGKRIARSIFIEGEI